MKNVFLLLIVAVLFLGCKEDKPTTAVKTPTVKPKPTVDVSAFSPNSAYDYIAKQVSFGPRVPGTKAHADCKDWLVKTFTDFNLEVDQHHFTTTEKFQGFQKGTNIIARINPEAENRVMLSAHWDTRHVADRDINEDHHDQALDGADDGGSGVGVVLELARLLSKDSTFNLGVDFVLFDLEDQGEYGNDPTSRQWCLGSEKWAKDYAPNIPKANFGILLDMVGARGAVFPREGFSRKYASHILNNVWNTAADIGHGARFVNVPFGNITDDHKFVNEIAHIPTIDIIHVGTSANQTFGAHWHTMNDNMSVIDRATLKAVGETVLAVLYSENQ